MVKVRRNVTKMSESHFNSIYSQLHKRITIIASKRYRNISGADYEDFVQVGLLGALDLPDGKPINMYVSRAKRRMIDHWRYMNRRATVSLEHEHGEITEEGVVFVMSDIKEKMKEAEKMQQQFMTSFKMFFKVQFEIKELLEKLVESEDPN